MKTQISIIGCGWLGFPVAKQFVEEGFRVKGSTTSKNKLEILKQHQINPFLIALTEEGILGDYSAFLSESETVIINIPPGLRKDPTKNHVAEIKHLIHAIEKHGVKNVLYISSTSVFEEASDFPIITAETIPNATSRIAKQLIEIEQMLQANHNFKTTILRFGGLVDDERHPSKYLAGRQDISDPEAPINLIHKTDCIAIISAILKKDLWNMALNAAYPNHPSKKDYYKAQCKNQNLPLPKFNSSAESKGKIIESKMLVQLLSYSFKVEP